MRYTGISNKDGTFVDGKRLVVFLDILGWAWTAMEISPPNKETLLLLSEWIDMDLTSWKDWRSSPE